MDAGVISFDLENMDSKLKKNLDFSIKYWQSNVCYNVNFKNSKPYPEFQNSGDYVFSPKDG